jgi:hypothetical protein
MDTLSVKGRGGIRSILGILTSSISMQQENGKTEMFCFKEVFTS